jgi:hypothetical protein
MSPDPRVAKNLRDAADYLKIYGWVPRQASSFLGPCCMLQALNRVTPAPDPKNEIFRTSMKFLREVTGPEDTIFNFNDENCKNRNDAVAALEISADLAS